MRSINSHRLAAVTILLFLLGASASDGIQAPRFQFESVDISGTRWFKGNTHAHTLESDGDSTPEEVATWYKEHGYNFLVLSDHNVLTDPASLAHLVDDDFLLIAGEEVTARFGQSSVHVNGLNIKWLVEPQSASTLVGTIQRNVDAIREVEGVPHINHPNYRWSFGAEELAQVENDRLLEIYNGHPTAHNEGGGDSSSMEAMWDYLLTRGKRIYGLAVDDAHAFKQLSPDLSNPGRGWISVRARSLDAAEIVANLERGLFYASTGVEIADFAVSSRRLEVHIEEDRDFKYTTTFIGTGGRVLKETTDNPAVFELPGPEIYVRARVKDSAGRRAWLQPAFVSSGSSGG